MIGEIQQLLEAKPFEPFSVVTSSGKQYRVLSRDHASINPKRTRVVIYFDDDDSLVSVAGLHIASVERPNRPVPD